MSNRHLHQVPQGAPLLVYHELALRGAGQQGVQRLKRLPCAARARPQELLDGVAEASPGSSLLLLPELLAGWLHCKRGRVRLVCAHGVAPLVQLLRALCL